MSSASHAPSTRVASPRSCRARRDRRDGERRRRRAARSRCAMPPFATGVALMRSSPSGRSASSSATGRPSSSKSSSGRYDRIHASSIARCSGFSRTPASGTWCARKVPSTCTPSTTAGRSSPSACAARSPASAAALGERAGRGIRSDLGDAVVGDVDRVGHAGVHGHRVLAVEPAGDEQRLVAVAAQEVDELRLGDAGEQGRVRDLEAVQVQDRQHRAVGHRVEERVRRASSRRAGRSRPRRRRSRTRRRARGCRAPRRRRA